MGRSRTVSCPVRYRDPEVVRKEREARLSESEQDRAVLEFMERKSPSLSSGEDEHSPPTNKHSNNPFALDLTAITNRPSPVTTVTSARSLLQFRQKTMLDPIIEVEKSRCGWQSA